MKCRQLRKQQLRQLWYKPYTCKLAVFGCTCRVGLELRTQSVEPGLKSSCCRFEALVISFTPC